MNRFLRVFAFVALLLVPWDAEADTPRNIAAAQVTVTGTATLVANNRANRQAVTVENHGTTEMFCGAASSVTTATGFRLPGVDGASLTVPTTAAVWCITGGGSQAVSVLESY